MRHKLVLTFKQSDESAAFFGLLALLFIGLKLTGFISWSWLWVLAPMWGPVVLAFGVLLIWLIGAGLFGCYVAWKQEQMHKKRMAK